MRALAGDLLCWVVTKINLQKEIYEIAKKKHKEETKLYHVYNFEKQIKLNKENNFSREKGNLHYFSSLICVDRKKPVKEIETPARDYDSVRRKAYGTLEDELEDTLNSMNKITPETISKEVKKIDDDTIFNRKIILKLIQNHKDYLSIIYNLKY